MKLTKLWISTMALLTSTACNGTQKDENNNEQTITMNKDSKALVVFFSHTGENYSVGNIKVGNTKIVADYISEFTGAAQFEVVCEKDYNKSYKEVCDIAKEEQEKGELPPYKGKIEDIDQYSVIFIGTPIWWGTFPQVMFTFFSKHDLNGKTLIPFSTHEGSGLGNIVSDLKTLYPKAKITGQFSIYGHDVRTSGKTKVEKWLKELGY